MSQLHDLYYFLFPTPLAAETAKELLRRLQGPRGVGRGEPMPLDRLHITLHYLGRFLNSIPREVSDLALAAGSAMDYEPFGVRLDVLQSRGGVEKGTFGTVELAPQAALRVNCEDFNMRLATRCAAWGLQKLRSAAISSRT